MWPMVSVSFIRRVTYWYSVIYIWFSGQASSRGVATVPVNVYTVITTSRALYRADS